MMPKRMRSNRRWLSCVCGLAAPLLLLSACSDDEATSPPPEDPSVIDGVPTNVTTVEEAVVSFAAAWTAMSEEAIDALLADSFIWYILDEDSEELAWVTGGFWDREIEMLIAENMMNPNYSGDELPVASIEVGARILAQEPILDSSQNVVGTSVTADVEITVLVGPDEGWFSDTRLLMNLVPDTGGFQRLSRTQEIRPLRSGRSVGTSWSGIKAIYR